MIETPTQLTPADCIPTLAEAAGPGWTCPRCQTEFAKDWSAAGCPDCEHADRSRAYRRIDRLRESGIPSRHLTLARFPDMQGPPEFERVRDCVRRFIEAPDGGMLALVGRRGVGKTQLLAAATLAMIERDRAARMIDLQALLSDERARIGGTRDSETDWVSDYGGLDLLCIDEIGQGKITERGHELLTELLDVRYREFRHTLLSGNLDKSGLIAVLGDSPSSRMFETGGVIACDWPSFRTPRQRTNAPAGTEVGPQPQADRPRRENAAPAA